MRRPRVPGPGCPGDGAAFSGPTPIEAPTESHLMQRPTPSRLDGLAPRRALFHPPCPSPLHRLRDLVDLVPIPLLRRRPHRRTNASSTNPNTCPSRAASNASQYDSADTASVSTPAPSPAQPPRQRTPAAAATRTAGEGSFKRTDHHHPVLIPPAPPADPESSHRPVTNRFIGMGRADDPEGRATIVSLACRWETSTDIEGQMFEERAQRSRSDNRRSRAPSIPAIRPTMPSGISPRSPVSRM
jgi:hypothetical protein